VSSSRYGFAGERGDSTGLQYLRARYYAPNVGRFITNDTWLGDKSVPGSLNRYAYVLNNPIRYIDPSGHDWWIPFGEFSEGLVFEFARINAIKTNAAVTLNFDWANGRLTVVDSGATTLATRTMPDDVALQDIDLGSPVIFDGHGFSTSAGRVRVLNTNDPTLRRSINLTLGGNASIQ